MVEAGYFRKRRVVSKKHSILDGRTNISEGISNQRFKGVSTRFGRRPFEKCFEKTFPNDCSAVQNLRLNMVTKKTSDCSHASRMFVVFCKPILAIWLQRKHQTIINRACLLCFVNTSCGTVVLQRGLDQPVVPGDRGVHGWDSFSASRSYWHELLLQLWNFSVANLFLSRFELGSKDSPCRSVPFLGSRAVVPLSESFQISFRDDSVVRTSTAGVSCHLSAPVLWW